MPGLFGTLYTASSGIRTQQHAIETTSHNIANTNTPGYTRQRTVTSTTSPYTNPSYTNSIGPGQIGTGVEVVDIERVRSTFHDFQFRNESHEYGKYSVKKEYYNSVENIFNEPSDMGISSSINRFFTSWQELGKDPNSISAKNLVIESGKYLADTISQTYNSLESLKNTVNDELNRVSQEITDIMLELNELDKSISIVQGAKKTPNDYLDRKDKLIDDLSSKLNIQDNDIRETLEAIVDKSKVDGKIDVKELNESIKEYIDTPYKYTYDANGENETKVIIDKDLSGEVQGYKDMGKEIQYIMDNLKNFSDAMKNSINTVSGKEFFDDTPEQLIEINKSIITELSITSDTANKIANLRDEKVKLEGELHDGISLRNRYNSLLENVGLKSQEAIRNEANQKKLIDSIDAARMSISAVSIDEEMVNLIQLQHSYSANAKVLSTLDSLLDIIINGIIK